MASFLVDHEVFDRINVAGAVDGRGERVGELAGLREVVLDGLRKLDTRGGLGRKLLNPFDETFDPPAGISLSFLSDFRQLREQHSLRVSVRFD